MCVLSFVFEFDWPTCWCMQTWSHVVQCNTRKLVKHNMLLWTFKGSPPKLSEQQSWSFLGFFLYVVGHFQSFYQIVLSQLFRQYPIFFRHYQYRKTPLSYTTDNHIIINASAVSQGHMWCHNVIVPSNITLQCCSTNVHLCNLKV